MSDLEDDWHALGRAPSKTERVLKGTSTRLKAMTEYLISLGRRFVDYALGLVGKAWAEFMRTVTEPERVFGLFILMVLLMGTWFVWSYGRSDGRIQYCYVDQVEGATVLVGERPWQANARLRILKEGESVELLYKTAKDLDCPLR